MKLMKYFRALGVVLFFFPHYSMPSQTNLVAKKEVTRLMRAALDGDYSKCQQLLEGSAQQDLNCKDFYGKTAIVFGAEGGNELVCELLLSRGANPNSEVHNAWSTTPTMSQPFTALLIAAKKGFEKVCRVLIDHGANLDFKDGFGRTALSLAVSQGHIKVINLLLEEYRKLYEKGTPLDVSYAYQIAFDGADLRICRLFLIPSGQLEIHPDSISNSWMTAISKGNESLCILFLEAGYATRGSEEKQFDLQQAFIAAAIFGNEALCRLFLENGAQVNGRNKMCRVPDCCTALMHAAEHGHGIVCKFLIAHGADVTIRNKTHGRTPLMIAAAKGHADVCEILLEKDPTIIDMQDEEGSTSLMLAATHGHQNVCRLLMQKNARQDLTNQDLTNND